MRLERRILDSHEKWTARNILLGTAADQKDPARATLVPESWPPAYLLNLSLSQVPVGYSDNSCDLHKCFS